MPAEDKTTGAQIAIPPKNAAIHLGKCFMANYSVPDIGAMTTPDDMITLSWTTEDHLKWMHLQFLATCSSGARIRLIEGKTGGGASPTGLVQSYNCNRNSDTVSIITDVAGANATKVSYDATLFTGGTTLIDEYVGAQGWLFSLGGESAGDIVLKRGTQYQISIYETSNVPANLKMSWVENISRN